MTRYLYHALDRGYLLALRQATTPDGPLERSRVQATIYSKDDPPAVREIDLGEAVRLYLDQQRKG